jgi:hypothetical protein
MDAARKRLAEWPVNPEEVTPDFEWFVGETLHSLPSKAKLRAAGLEPVLLGWKPDRPIIEPATRVLALGSCFARYFILWLGDHGFNKAFAGSPYEALIKFDFSFESVAVVAQQFRWAFKKFDARDALWIGENRQRVQPTDEIRLLARETLQQSEVIIITLGLSEIWYDKTTGEPMWRAVPKSSYDPSRHAFKVLSVAETRAALDEIDAIRREHLPQTKIVFTVSPIRLRATFRPISALTANSVSKAILRAALDEFLRAHWDEVNANYFYFPSYEIVTELMGDAFLPDMRHVYDHVPQQVMALFAEHYTTLPPDRDFPVGKTIDADLRRTIAELEDKVVELQRVSDERMGVIEELAKAARERLELIERLDAEVRELSVSKPKRA